MRLTSLSSGDVPAGTARLLRRMLCPLTGLTQAIGFVLRDPMEPRLAVAGGEMTGVHMLRGSRPPKPGAYHIGGCGTTYAEALIKTLGETIERYSHFAALADGLAVTLTTSRMARADDTPSFVPDGSALFSGEQYRRPGFPFEPLSEDREIGWVRARSLIDGAPVAIPAQQALVGYLRSPGEPRFTAGVTTGSAAHTDPVKALRNALLEVVQIDAAIGLWHGAAKPVQIVLDERVAAAGRAIDRTLHPHGPSLRFFWLPNPDLVGLSVACLVESPAAPHVALGLGCDLRLSQAIYKAFLEGVAVAHLAKIILFRQRVEEAAAAAAADHAVTFYDLDSNVGHYASGADGEVIRSRFPGRTPIAASRVAPDAGGSPSQDVARLIEAFAATSKRLALLDLTTPDVADLGFAALRVWSPDTLCLPLPSAPPLLHPRFAAYGGVALDRPHPYP
ncbi:MAG: YcaO-like family protein [Caulobacteraceae bacterium]|nr:YcaO-like family protein [Caulobacteraceae bacterium]